jgi:hypothetical protein
MVPSSTTTYPQLHCTPPPHTTPQLHPTPRPSPPCHVYSASLQDEGSPFLPIAAIDFDCADDSLWNILIYGMERVCDDIANDCVTCNCIVDSAFCLLTKPEQCSEACRLFVQLLTGVPIRCVVVGQHAPALPE